MNESNSKNLTNVEIIARLKELREKNTQLENSDNGVEFPAGREAEKATDNLKEYANSANDEYSDKREIERRIEASNLEFASFFYNSVKDANDFGISRPNELTDGFVQLLTKSIKLREALSGYPEREDIVFKGKTKNTESEDDKAEILPITESQKAADTAGVFDLMKSYKDGQFKNYINTLIQPFLVDQTKELSSLEFSELLYKEAVTLAQLYNKVPANLQEKYKLKQIMADSSILNNAVFVEVDSPENRNKSTDEEMLNVIRKIREQVKCLDPVTNKQATKVIGMNLNSSAFLMKLAENDGYLDSKDNLYTVSNLILVTAFHLAYSRELASGSGNTNEFELVKGHKMFAEIMERITAKLNPVVEEKK
jgi:hypothetical protein